MKQIPVESNPFYSVDVPSFSDDDLPFGAGSAFLAGYGTVWFESDATMNFRKAASTTEVTGLGFVRFWDRTGAFPMPSTIERGTNPHWE